MSASERFQGANVIDAGSLSPYWGEHTARYTFALPYVKGKSVLDIACGTGYGLAFLKSQAKSVTGVDVDIEAAREAIAECDSKSTKVLLGDGTSLPFPDETFDVITSFETLEHLENRREMLADFRRVLKAEGTLILSTPNSNYTEPIDGIPKNPFHVFEYSPQELKAELEDFFEVKTFLGQSLDNNIEIPPFQDAQLRLPKDKGIQAKLFAWKVFNKIPLGIREWLSQQIWQKPFYPTDVDYEFSEEGLEIAPVLVAVCRKI